MHPRRFYVNLLGGMIDINVVVNAFGSVGIFFNRGLAWRLVRVGSGELRRGRDGGRGDILGFPAMK